VVREATVPQERLACGRTRVLETTCEATVVPVCNTAMKSKAIAVIERSEWSQRRSVPSSSEEGRPAGPCVAGLTWKFGDMIPGGLPIPLPTPSLLCPYGASSRTIHVGGRTDTTNRLSENHL